MSKLNRDVLYLIFQELQDYKRVLYSCLLVNRTWFEIIIPILWKDPWNSKEEKKKSLLNAIILHLSDESKNKLKSQYINFLTYSHQKPLINYINFCRHLNINEIHKIIDTRYYIYEKSKLLIIKNEIFNLFINGDTKFTHLYIPRQFDNQIKIFSGTERCFSELEFLSCNTSINDNVLTGLAEICKSIKELELFIEQSNNNYGIVKLIETPRKLFNISFQTYYQKIDESFCKILENSLIKHANSVKHYKITKQPITNILTSFVNLKVLELNGRVHGVAWNYLENLSLPSLRNLKANGIPVRILANLIENTSGYLIEVKIGYTYHDVIDNKRIIQAIYQNCPNLKYLRLCFRNSNILELKNLLINCQCLNGLVIIIINEEFGWDDMFKILTKSSPTSLYRFKFKLYTDIRVLKLSSLKLFFDDWKGRHPMLLQIIPMVRDENMDRYSDLMEEYKAEGIVKKYDMDLYGKDFEDFEWIQKS